MKKITSLTLGLSFLVMSYTGIILFITPQGKVAYWSNWTMLGLSKDQYAALHSTSMVVFLIFGSLHIYYNWRPIVSYLKNKSASIDIFGANFLTALLINVLFVVGTLAEVPPFSSFVAMGEKIKSNWARDLGEPPYGHAEESSLKGFCSKLNIDIGKAKSNLEKDSIKFQNEMQTVKSIADQNDITPNQLYKIIKGGDVKDGEEKKITKLGRKTIEELSIISNEIDLQKSIEYLKSQGIKDADKNSKIKTTAEILGLTPYELFDKLREL